MENAQAMVKAFHRMFDIVIQEAPAPIDDRTHALRIRLIHEEFEELKEAMAKNDLAGIAKEMADLLYVVYGTAVSYGIDMDPVFREVVAERALADSHGLGGVFLDAVRRLQRSTKGLSLSPIEVLPQRARWQSA